MKYNILIHINLFLVMLYFVHTFFYFLSNQPEICFGNPQLTQNQKIFYFLTQILFNPSLDQYMCGGIHAKFQDSRTDNKKSTGPFQST